MANRMPAPSMADLNLGLLACLRLKCHSLQMAFMLSTSTEYYCMGGIMLIQQNIFQEIMSAGDHLDSAKTTFNQACDV